MSYIRRRAGFTLVELLVVVGIIALLIGVLLPTLSKARLKGQQVVCQSNLKQLFAYMTLYCNNNKGYMFPIGPPRGINGWPATLGTTKMPHERWPAVLFSMKIGTPAYPNLQTTYDSDWGGVSGTDINAIVLMMQKYDAAPYTPKVMVCPTDQQPYEAHSYVVNQEMVQNNSHVRFSSGNRGGRSSSEIIVAGEKRSICRDYYMERPADTQITASSTPKVGIDGTTYDSEFDRVVEPYRHGLSYGSNFLFLDGHVATQLPNIAKGAVDPWDLPNTVTTQPTK